VLYREHSPRIYALCLRLTGWEREAAAALLQDVFVRAWRGLPSFRGDAPFAAWLHRLAVNAMLQAARANKRREARVMTVDPFDGGDVAREHDPGVLLDLEKAIAELPEGARTAFVLHHVEGYRYEEIATQLGVAVGTVKAQTHRARQLLMKVLDR
jgi:RNA polymerase sigma-70 factor, ECF subfamily